MKTMRAFKHLSIVVTLTVLIGGMGMQDAHAASNKNSFVGSWTVVGSPNPPGSPMFINLGSIHRDGTVVNSDPVFGGGHGVWKRVGPRSFEVKFLTLVPPNNPFFPPNALITVTGVVTLEDGGQLASGNFDTTFEDALGNLLLTMDGTVTFTRIQFD